MCVDISGIEVFDDEGMQMFCFLFFFMIVFQFHIKM